MSVQAVYLKDDFEDNVVATAWVASASGSAAVAETSGQARFTLPSSTAGTHTARYTSRVAYDLTGSSFFINIGTMVAAGVAATAFVQLYLNGTNIFNWIQISGTIYARKVIAGVSTDLFSAAWSGSTYKYLRIRESAGSVLWDSSTNGTSWTNRYTLVGLPFAITDLFVDFGATCGNVASPGSFRLDDVNLLLPALTTAWNWTQVVWPFDERTETITAAIDVVGSVMGYAVTADEVDASDNPSGNVRYWSGPADSGRILTEQPTQAAAQAMAVYFPLDGRMDLEAMVEGHCYRIYHRSVDGLSYILRELFPRRTIYADDIKAESITALHLRADIITAREIGTVDLDATARITAGGGAVILDDSGISIDSSSAYVTTDALNFRAENSALHSAIYAQRAPTVGDYTNGLLVLARMDPLGVEQAYITIGTFTAAAPLNKQIALIAAGGRINLDAARLEMTGALAIHGAPAGSTTVGLGVKGFGATNATAAISVTNSTNLINFQSLDDGSIRTRTGNRWDLRGFVNGALTITGHVDVLVDGTLRRLLVG